MDKKSKFKRALEVFWSFFKIGAFTIGGGYAMLPLFQKEVVETKKWLTEDEIVDVYAIVQSVPGVIAINASIFIGYKIGGIAMSIVSALGVILPSFIIILLIAPILILYNENPYVIKAFTGVRAGVTALILLSAIKLGKKVVKDPFSLILAATAAAIMLFTDIGAIWVILGSALIGLVLQGYRRKTNY
ncbi:MAG TPA: chromate transporter [Clostridiales bacterium]|nr:chromate transporter [Clostridiales bacterium]